MARTKARHLHPLYLGVGALLLSLCITSCALQEKASLSAHVRQEMVRPPGEEHKFVRDAVSRLVFMIENNSDDVVVLRDCSIPGQLPDIERWHGARYGSTEYRPLEDEWRYHEMAQQLSEPVFAMGVIPPGGNVKVERWAVLKEDFVVLDVAYHKLTPAEAKRYLYVETGDDSFAGSESIFRHPENLASDTNWRIVIFPEAETLDIKSQTLTCAVSLREPKDGVELAQAVVGEPIIDAVYCQREQAWIVRTTQGVYLVAGQTCIPLPEMDLLSFVVIESSYRVVRCLLPETGYDDVTSQEKDDENRWADADITQVPQSAIRDLLERARERGHRITVRAHDPTGLGAPFCLVIGSDQAN